jgi:hypothetical protein
VKNRALCGPKCFFKNSTVPSFDSLSTTTPSSTTGNHSFIDSKWRGKYAIEFRVGINTLIGNEGLATVVCYSSTNGNRFQHSCIELRIFLFFATASNEGKIAARCASVFRGKEIPAGTFKTANEKAVRFARAFRYSLV